MKPTRTEIFNAIYNAMAAERQAIYAAQERARAEYLRDGGVADDHADDGS